jgi:hypothetical protein
MSINRASLHGACGSEEPDDILKRPAEKASLTF